MQHLPTANVFPGECSGATTGTLAGCLDERVECRVCLAINAIDGLSVDCDLFDDGAANSSCPPAVVASCPLTPGSYTITQVSGGTLKVSTFAPFAFPTGGTIVEDVGAGDANCVHQTVVPFPGGFSAPTFCVPALGYSVHIDQTGCGIGEIDSDGGSDFTVTELGDTSDTSGPCNLPNAPAQSGVDGSIRVDITVGDSVTDVCGGPRHGELDRGHPGHHDHLARHGRFLPGLGRHIRCGHGYPDHPVPAEPGLHDRQEYRDVHRHRR